MEYPTFKYSLPNGNWIPKLLQWANSIYPFFIWTDGNSFPYEEGPFERKLLAGRKALPPSETWTTTGIKKAGIISYEYKNDLENLESNNPAFLDFPKLLFFRVNLEIKILGDHLISNQELKDDFWDALKEPNDNKRTQSNPIQPKAHCRKKEYLEAIKKIKQEITEGNTYELNFCQAFSAQFEQFDPIETYIKLNRLSPMPFSALFKAKSKWLISASPERFLKKKDSMLIAQPIKGTFRRGSNPEEDQKNRELLFKSEKERAENLMITDLTRNDLSKVSETGSVRVSELFGIYSLPKVFQMVSTVKSIVRPNTSLEEILSATFPMGSMTGAPKIKTMELIEELENFQRGWFSGALGWIDEKGDFDFSVVIRSIITDLSTKKLYFAVGSAITIDADAESEYEECLLKASAILEVLSGK